MKTMTHRLLAAAALAAALSLPAAAAGQAASRGAAGGSEMLVRVEASAEIQAAPAAVWAALHSSEGVAALTGFKPDQAGATLGKAGQALHGQGAWDAGTVVLLRSVAEKELKVAFDPDHGGYLCQTRIRLEPRGAGTRLTVQDAYSEDKPAQAEKNRQGALQGLEKGLEAFRKVAESSAKKAPR